MVLAGFGQQSFSLETGLPNTGAIDAIPVSFQLLCYRPQSGPGLKLIDAVSVASRAEFGQGGMCPPAAGGLPSTELQRFISLALHPSQPT